MPRTVFAGVRFAGVAVALAIASAAGLHASTLTLSPQPARTGQAITATYSSFSCEGNGQLMVEHSGPGSLVLLATPGQCSVLPCCWVEYTAQANLGALLPGIYVVEVYEGNELAEDRTLRERRLLEVLSTPVCTSTATQLCLGDSHFEVTARWEDFAGNSGSAQTVPDQLEGLGNHGLFWFFTADNPELLVKVLDGCAINGRYWVFVSPGSNVQYDVTVRDVRSGKTRTYSNPLHSFPSLFADTNSFSCVAP